MYIHTCIYVHIYMCVYIYIYICMYIYIYMYICMCVTHTHTCMYIYVYIYITGCYDSAFRVLQKHTHTHTHTHTNTHTHRHEDTMLVRFMCFKLCTEYFYILGFACTKVQILTCTFFLLFFAGRYDSACGVLQTLVCVFRRFFHAFLGNWADVS
jgi:hypothetical protein